MRLGSVLVFLVGFCAALSTSTSHSETLRSTNFKFGEGRPFGGLVTLDDVQVQLVTTNTEPWGETGFRDQLTGIPAFILFCFSRPVAEFRISFSRIYPGETLRDFTAGPPTPIEGDVIETGELIYSVPPKVGDYGKGTFIWKDLETDVFGFVIDNDRGHALAVDEIALSVSRLQNGAESRKNIDQSAALETCNFLQPEDGQKRAN